MDLDAAGTSRWGSLLTSCLAASFVIVAFAALSREEFSLFALIIHPFVLLPMVIMFTCVPYLAGLWASHQFKIRHVAAYAAFGVFVGGIVSLLFGIHHSLIGIIFMCSGFSGGNVYWWFAGRRAGLRAASPAPPA